MASTTNKVKFGLKNCHYAKATLDQFGTFSICKVLPEIIALWGLNVQTQVESKKNFDRLTGK